MKIECIDCGETYNPKRHSLGYRHCLECGESSAQREKQRKSRCTAPAYNKGAYMYITGMEMARNVGR
jgi:predicted  nucleic acid-binding Zn-ribbon protein